MGEPVVDVYRGEDKDHKMGERAASKPDLEVSVSFGRFENDSLSWEKWSAFSPNKYLEEVEKFATPGSVAEKKAYFEAHYKKIAARRAELMDQANQMENDPLRPENQNGGDLTSNVSSAGFEFDICNSHSPTEEVVKQETNLVSEVISTHVADLKEDAAISTESQRTLSEGVEEEMGSRIDSPKSSKPEEAVLVKEEEEEAEESTLVESQDTKEISHKDNAIGNAPKVKEEKAQLEHPKESKKVPPVNRDRNVTRVKKKASPPVTKASHLSTPKVSKPTPASTAISATRSSTKKGNDWSLPRSKNSSTVEIKKVAPKSLYMSLSMDPTNSDPTSLPTTRKSFIMEKMGDKDIVKRAFKTFEKSFNQLKSSAEERSSVPKQVPAKGTGPRVSTSTTSRKENGGSLKPGCVDKRIAKAAPSSYGLKSDERAKKTNKFSKKLEEKSNAKEAVRTGLQSKSKEQKETDIRKLRQSLNFKATPVPSFYRGVKMSKSTSDKDVSKNEVHR
ncbi:protein WVD2-like 7 [Corylus avellana]|uniref:protein WVD2-like 7 n=1 Tax=Corylus avellana TaxID=13451 RepID=UPI00286D0E67|nr:protein WVD2-like 7 [Corylus avellana]XP_059447535.1 protein WVD2-like 7 [Corylus avellana]XP_059447536.1 protein WVD2-like 7 [Corylus avellana]XP_059447537.1 protein WVD2-like 7 [Corylus avellana]XP_059447538.1 protein WVD2-like 7 [Corylus avellana]XP_059447539.1 protein WVD2-like 7 [Corylus avellana]